LKIEPLLHQLEARIETKMWARLGYDTPRGQTLQSARRGYYLKEANSQFADWKTRLDQRNAGTWAKKDAAYSKLITEVLTEIELGAGFSMYQDMHGHPKVPMIMPLKAPQFRGLLTAKRPFKDPTIGPDHGEYTHRVQWALIVLGNVVNAPALVYQRIGEVPWTVSSDFGLWDALVDRQPVGAPSLPQPFPFYKRNDHDFRTPEALLTWLCSPAQQSSYPLLAGFLKSRKDKRQYVNDNDSARDPLLFNYLSRKIFGVPLEALDKEQGQYVEAFIQGGQQKGILAPHPQKPTYRPVG
jgi:hypothetical protein